ncbi:hypothetical protein EI171_12645 [Bradyrhizobium sp. LCT2]|nr:hypothetical protein EI171_12645 [Bradyrhizobium sp. LCT2]
MVRGDAVIVQAALQDGHWSGRADVLRRVEIPSGLGAWVLRSHGRQVSARDQRQHGPATQSLTRTCWRRCSRGPRRRPTL